MSTYDLYTTPVEPGTWDVPAAGAARFALGDSRWDMPYLGMQVLIEGLALARAVANRSDVPSGRLGRAGLAA
ncbi:MAG TPA: hypothetical protein VJ371_22465, partial [Streptosporangiaceae bacterium]|nr:hypothetical protein [Streptosporangiaceae bacterium]